MTSIRSVPYIQKSALSGALLVACAGLFWSFSGTFVRLAPHLDSWQYLTYRAIGLATAFYVYDRVQRRQGLIKRFSKLGWSGILGAVLMAASFISYILSIQATSVAFTLFVYSSAPMMAGAMAYFVLGEKMTVGMFVAVIFALVGLAIMINGQLSGGSFYGFVLAVIPALLFSYYAVMQRQHPELDFAPAVSGFAFIVVAVSIVMMLLKGEALFPNAFEAGAAFANGFVTMGLGFVLYQLGAARIPAASQVLLAQVETLFGPFWVWLFFNERTGLATLIGGAVILVGVVIMAYSGVRQEAARTHQGLE